jgi:hypothetical protein
MAPVRKGDKRTPAVPRMAAPVSAQAAVPRTARAKDGPVAPASVERVSAKAARPPNEQKGRKSATDAAGNGSIPAGKRNPPTARSQTKAKTPAAKSETKSRAAKPAKLTPAEVERDLLKAELSAALARVSELEARLTMVSDRVVMAANMLRKLLTDS